MLDFGGPADLVNLGTFTDVVPGHDEAGRIRWPPEWTLPKTPKIPDQRVPRRSTLFEGDRLRTRM